MKRSELQQIIKEVIVEIRYEDYSQALKFVSDNEGKNLKNKKIPNSLVLDINMLISNHYVKDTGDGDDYGKLYLTNKGKKALSNIERRLK